MPPLDQPPREPTFEELLHHPEVVAAIRRVLGKYGFRAQDLEDGYQDVVVKALSAKGPRPTTKNGVKALCIVIAHRHGVSALRAKGKWKEVGHVGLTDVADEQSASAFADAQLDRLDARKLLELLEKVVPGHIVEQFADVAAEMDQQEMAAERGVPYKKVRRDLERGRLKYTKAVLAAGFGVLLAAGAVWVFFVRGSVGSGGPQEAVTTPGTAPSAVMVNADDVERQRKKDEAVKLRAQATELCAAKQWKACDDALNEALAMDPDGEGAPGVVALRDQVERSIAAKLAPSAVPSGTPAPPPKK